ncbi:MAG: hypothetical protein ACTS6H_02055 [Candidatus Hodgkinia cicadicola]
MKKNNNEGLSNINRFDIFKNRVKFPPIIEHPKFRNLMTSILTVLAN